MCIRDSPCTDPEVAQPHALALELPVPPVAGCPCRRTGVWSDRCAVPLAVGQRRSRGESADSPQPPVRPVAAGRQPAPAACGSGGGLHRVALLRDNRRPWLPAGSGRRDDPGSVSYTHLRAHETVLDLVCRLLLEKKKKKEKKTTQIKQKKKNNKKNQKTIKQN